MVRFRASFVPHSYFMPFKSTWGHLSATRALSAEHRCVANQRAVAMIYSIHFDLDRLLCAAHLTPPVVTPRYRR